MDPERRRVAAVALRPDAEPVGLGEQLALEKRIASLQALGDIGDPSVAVWVTALLRDTEPTVRIEALRTLGRFQDKRKAEFKILAEKLRADYEDAVRRAAARR